MAHVSYASDDGPADFEREKALVEQLKQKNPEAWKEFTTQYQPRLKKAIRRSLTKYRLPLDRQDDIEQKTWVTVIQKLYKFEPKQRDSLYYWLVTIQRNHVRNLSREPMPVNIEETTVEAEGELPSHFQVASSHNPESEFINAENHREIWSALEMALQTLTPRDREIMVERLVYKKEVEALANLYKVKPQTIYQITANVKRKIANYLLASELFLRVYSDRTGKESKQWKK